MIIYVEPTLTRDDFTLRGRPRKRRNKEIKGKAGKRNFILRMKKRRKYCNEGSERTDGQKLPINPVRQNPTENGL